MKLFDLFKKNKIIKKDLLNLPCDYDGYDIVFKDETTKPTLYSEFNNIITDNKLYIDDINEYQKFSADANNDTFNIFYDAWIKKLFDRNFVVLLDSHVNIMDFATGVNNILKSKGESAQIDINSIAERYNNELKKYAFNGNKITENLNYDILEANIVADELRKFGYELICLFNGYDNNIKTIVRIEDIEKLKYIEQKIKETN